MNAATIDAVGLDALTAFSRLRKEANHGGNRFRDA
jgi:hypothetical protein